VEAALVFPLLILLTFAAIEYGWMFLKQQQITNIARQAARTAVTPNTSSGEVTSLVSTMMNNAGLGSSGYSLGMTNVEGNAGDLVTVTISVNYGNVTITHMANPDNLVHIPAPATLSARVVMSKEGP
jgi:Flp pilus assembly protein TadG